MNGREPGADSGNDFSWLSHGVIIMNLKRRSATRGGILLLLFLIGLALFGCGNNSAGSINSDIKKQWVIGKKYSFADNVSGGKGTIKSFHNIPLANRNFVEVGSQTKKVKLKLRHFPKGITFVFIDRTLVAIDEVVTFDASLKFKLLPASRTKGKHQLMVAQFAHDDRDDKMLLCHKMTYYVK